MNELKEEIQRRLKHYYVQLAALADAYFYHEIDRKEYVVQYEKIKAKIQLLE